MFERGDRVKITQPFSPDAGKAATVIASAGSGAMIIAGLPFYFADSFMVYIDGYGAIDLDTNRPIVYPMEFLEYLEPEIPDQPLRSTWEQFDAEVGFSLSNIITQGPMKHE